MAGPDEHKYDGILYHPHHQSTRHPHMSLLNRAAQFSPFAALTGYGDAIDETARRTDRKIELSDDEQNALSAKLTFLSDYLDELGRNADRPVVEITYYVPDNRKAGGAYLTIAEAVKLVDPIERMIVLVNRKKIPIDDVIQLSGPLFKEICTDFD